MTTPIHAAARAWSALGGESADLEHLQIHGGDPIYPSPFHVASAAAGTIGAAALAAAGAWADRTGAWQEVRVEATHAAVAFRSERYLRYDREEGPVAGRVAGYYRTADGRWFQLHAEYPHHRERALALLGVAEADRSLVERAIGEREGQALEDALIEAGGVGYVLRSPEEWRTHPQSDVIAAIPLLSIERSDDGSGPAPWHGAATAPLAGVRVLDLTRVIAGPIAGRTMTSYGADVLRIGSPSLPVLQAVVVDTGFGKRFAHLDLRDRRDRETLRGLIRDADVVVQGYRPGAIAGLGFGFEECAALRPGIVYASLCAWSEEGPWSQRRGFDSLVQTATGIAYEGGAWAGHDGDPGPLPCQALDHGTGYLLAAAVMTALRRRADEGGAYEIRASLSQTGHWIASLGRVSCSPDRPDIDARLASAHLMEMDSEWGRLQYVRPAGVLSETPPAWRTPPSRPGADEPVWLPR